MHLARQFTTIYLQQAISYYKIQSCILRVVRCTSHRHCHHCHCHHQTCRCRIHLLCCLRSNYDPILNHLAMCILQQVLKIVVVTMAMVVALVVLHKLFCVIGGFRFAGFISTSGNCYPLNPKGTSSPFIFLVHPDVQGSICVSQRSVQYLYW